MILVAQSQTDRASNALVGGIAIHIFFYFIVAFFGNNRTIGYWGAFAISVLSSPILSIFIGFDSTIFISPILTVLICLLVPKKQKLKPNTITKNDITSELVKLNDLKEKGIFTEEEFNKQKQKILNG